jgi:hypothetical protein
MEVYMVRSISAFICAILLLVSFGCSSQNFVVVRDGTGAHAGKVLGMRTVADVRALAPTDKLTWLEYCEAVTTHTLEVFSSTDYVNCVEDSGLLAIARNSVSTGYVAGIAGPVLQAGAIVGGAALIGNGISKSGSTTNTTNTNTANGGKGGAGTENSGPVLKNSFNNNGNSGIIGNKNHVKIDD